MTSPTHPALPFDAVLFDCDGVLVDSEAITNRVLVQMLGELGWRLSLEESLGLFVGRSMRDELPMIAARTGSPVDEAWLRSFWARRDAVLGREVEAVPGIADVLRQLHGALQGRIACASGADRGKIELMLGKVGLRDIFAGRIFSGYEVPRSKPWPDVYLAAADALGVAPARCAVIEDSVIGAQAGLAAGATVFGYSPGGLSHSSAEALRAAGVAQVFSDMARLPALLAAWRPGAAPG